MHLSWSSFVLLGVIACTGSSANQPKPQPPIAKADPVATPPQSSATSFKAELVAARPGVVLEAILRDAKTKDPVVGATVVVTSPALQGEQVTISDEAGRVAFDALPPGKYTLTAYYNDATTTGAFDVQAGKTSTVALDWDLTPAEGEVILLGRTPNFKTAIEALQHGALAQAVELGTAEVAKAPSAKLHAILAMAQYGSALEQLRFGAFASASDRKRTGKDLKQAMANFLAGLEQTQVHLANAAKDPKFSFELCVACIASGDDSFLTGIPRGAFDIEHDRAGKELPEGDARRRPTYHFDHGDLTWARAMVSFQQAAVSVTLAYDWDWMDTFLADNDRDDRDDTKAPTKITIKLLDAARVAKAKELIVAGLTASDECRAEFVAETDDDREWVPNPKQKSYASPLAIDDKVFKTWAEVIGDVRTLIAAKEGLPLKALWTLAGERSVAPVGFLDFGAMLATPKDIVVELDVFDRVGDLKSDAKRNETIIAFLKLLLGNGYKPTMKASKLGDRLIQLRKDMASTDDAFETKLKYILWLN